MLFVLAGWLLIGKRRSPDERERARRLFLASRGRVTEAEITQVEGARIGYCYQVNSVTYHVVQDVQPFAHLLPRDSGLLLGPAIIKYSTGNPASSILISEDWSGIRIARPAIVSKQNGE
jgi:hypothetical protein